MAIPSTRESTTVTGTGDWAAARCAPCTVADMSAEMCTETMASAPAAASRSYASRNSAGAGRDVVTGTNRRSASARSSRRHVDALAVLLAADDDMQGHDVEPHRLRAQLRDLRRREVCRGVSDDRDAMGPDSNGRDPQLTRCRRPNPRR
jgi:hypothetical protein